MPLKDLQRLKQIGRYLRLQIRRKDELEDILKLAVESCGTNVALITLLDEETQFYQYRADDEKTEHTHAFCAYASQQNASKEFLNSDGDLRLVNCSETIGSTIIKFYAGVQLITQDGHTLGSICVIDQQSKMLTQSQQNLLKILSRKVIQILEFELSINILKDQFIKAKQSEITLRSFFESTISCHLLIGKTFEVLAFNRSLSHFIWKVYNTTITEGMDVRPYIHQSHKRSFIKNYKKALSGKNIISEIEIDYGDKTIYWYICFEPAYNDKKEIIGVSYNATDVTERVRQERLVFSQNESLRKIAFIQSHELRRPVSSILGLLDMIKKEDYYNNQEELVLLEQAVKEMDTKIKDIVNYTV